MIMVNKHLGTVNMIMVKHLGTTNMIMINKHLGTAKMIMVNTAYSHQWRKQKLFLVFVKTSHDCCRLCTSFFSCCIVIIILLYF